MKEAAEFVRAVCVAVSLDQTGGTPNEATLAVIRAIQSNARGSAWIKIDPKNPATWPPALGLTERVVVWLPAVNSASPFLMDKLARWEPCGTDRVNGLRSRLKSGKLRAGDPTHWQPIAPPS